MAKEKRKRKKDTLNTEFKVPDNLSGREKGVYKMLANIANKVKAGNKKDEEDDFFKMFPLPKE